MTNRLVIPQRHISIAVTELTEDILSEKQIKNLAVHQSSYHIISGYLESSSYMFLDRILLTLLPLSKNRLIDICLPYLYNNSKSKAAKTLARYIIFDNKLRGIRVCSGQDWWRRRCESLPPPNFVQKYYQQNNIPFEQNEVLVGNFYLQFPRCSIWLLFQSEIIDKNNIKDTYNQHKFDILSVSGNLIKHTKDNNSVRLGLRQKDLTSRLKALARETMATVVYSGLKIAPSLTSYYFDRSYAIQGDNMISQTKTYFGQQNTTIYSCDLQETMKRKLQHRLDEIDDEDSDVNQLINVLPIKKALLPISKNTENCTHVQREQKRFMNQNLSDKEMLLLHLWFIYKTVNQQSPFVIPHPLADKSQFLYSHLVKLEEYSIISLEKLVQIYRYKQGQNTKLKSKIYNDVGQMVQSNVSLFPKFIYVYTNDEEEVSNLRRHSKYGQRICNCNLINPSQMEIKQTYQEKGGKLSLHQIRKVQIACNHVINQRYQSIEDVLKYFEQIKLSQAEIQYSFTEMFLRKIKKNVKLIPLYLFLLHSSKEQILLQVKEAQLRLASDDKYIGLDDFDEQNSSTIKRSYRQKVESAKVYKRKLSKGSKCHICELFFTKNLICSCPVCKQSICFDCIDNLTGNILTDLSDYRCIICTKRCKCNKCLPQSPQIMEEQPTTKPQQKNTDIFDTTNFGCSFCQIMFEEKSINLECIQCKKMVCYACHIRQLNPSETNIWTCIKCRKFEQEKQQSKMVQISIQAEQLQPLLPEIDQIAVQMQIERKDEKKQIQKSPIKPIDQSPIKKDKPQLKQKKESQKILKSPKKLRSKKSSKSKSNRRDRSSKKQRSSSSSSSSSIRQSSSYQKSRSRSRDKPPKKTHKNPSSQAKFPQALPKIPSNKHIQPQKKQKPINNPSQKNAQMIILPVKQTTQVKPDKVPIAKQQKPQKPLWGAKPKQQYIPNYRSPTQQPKITKPEEQASHHKNQQKSNPQKGTRSNLLFEIENQSNHEQYSY